MQGSPLSNFASYDPPNPHNAVGLSAVGIRRVVHLNCCVVGGAAGPYVLVVVT
jgi:hypothetical protein